MGNCFSHALFRQWWHCAAARELLDEQDIELLELEDSAGGEDQLGAQSGRHGTALGRQKLKLLPVASFGVVVVGAIAMGTFSANFVFLLLSAALALFLLSSALLILLLPRLACWLWARHVDDRFRHFVLGLRRRELALFGLRHFSSSSSPSSSSPHRSAVLPFRAQRVQCLRQLCRFVRAFNTASARLVLTSNERDSLLFNFVGDEMRTLCDAGETAAVDDDNDLHINSLKSLWQYHFLVRSEFIRCALLALRHDLWRREHLAFCRHLALILNTVRATTTAVPLCITNVYGRTSSRTNANNVLKSGADLAVASRASMCRAQLEWALERLQPSPDDGGADSAWPPPPDVVKCVEQVAVSLRHALEECQLKQCPPQQLPAGGGDASFHGQNADDELLAQCQAQSCGSMVDDEEDYQIFELDTATVDNGNNNNSRKAGKRRSICEEEDEFFVSANSAAGVALTHDAVLRELGAALTLRKEQCLRRERRALARARGLPDEAAVPAEELDRTPFAAAAAAAASRDVTTVVAPAAAAVLMTPPNQAALMPSAEAVAAQRAAILGLQQRNEMEQFGDDEEDEEE
ncbi:hypothetical protein niasHT_008661 [Heterodera trifolii]|uniref:Vezatin n=1 Tax=Heterodera trifolii TaxID=157864 RepID=A0ABD2LX00_9BILA